MPRVGAMMAHPKDLESERGLCGHGLPDDLSLDRIGSGLVLLWRLHVLLCWGFVPVGVGLWGDWGGVREAALVGFIGFVRGLYLVDGLVSGGGGVVLW